MKRVMSMCSGLLRGRSGDAVIPLYGNRKMNSYTIPRGVCIGYKKRCTDMPYSDTIPLWEMTSVTAKSRFGADVSDLSRQPGHHSDPLAGLLTPFRSGTATGRTLYAIVKNRYKFLHLCDTGIKPCNTDYRQNIAHEKQNCNSFCRIFSEIPIFRFQYVGNRRYIEMKLG